MLGDEPDGADDAAPSSGLSMTGLPTGGEDRVLHVVPPDGGGVDRCVRDLCRARPQDWIVHACEDQCVLELPGPCDRDDEVTPAGRDGDDDGDGRLFLPLAMDDALELLFDGAWGVPTAVHAHGTTAAVRRLCRVLSLATGAPAVLTLHDVGFDDAALPALERRRRQAFGRWAAARTAPSDTLARRAQAAALGPCRRIDNGCDPLPPTTHRRPDLPAGAPGGAFAVAVIGAIGEHKGLQRLLEVAALLPPAVRIVVLGYTGQQLVPGWSIPGRLWMHGALEPADVPGLVERYGARLAWFPPGVPEGFGYALSDAWQAGLPALVPDHGALAERVLRVPFDGAGWTYAGKSDAAALAARVLQALDPAMRQGGGGARQAAATLTTVQAMAGQMTALYAEAGQGAAAARPADVAQLRALARPHLDARFFRREIRDLTAQLAAAQTTASGLSAVLARKDGELAAAHGALAELDTRRAAWAADREALDAERQALRQALQVLQEGHAALQAEHAALQHAHASSERHRASLQQRHGALTARLAAPLRVLPASWRERARAMGRRWLIP